MAFLAFLVLIVQNFEGFNVGFFKLLAIVGLEPHQGLDVALDLSDHQVQFFDVFQSSLVLLGPIFFPNAFQEFEMMGLVGYHFFLLDDLLFIFEPDQGQFSIEIVFFLEEAIQLPEE